MYVHPITALVCEFLFLRFFCHFGVIDCYRVLEDGDRRTEGRRHRRGSDVTLVCVSRPIPLFKPGRTHFRDERLYLCLYHSGMPHALCRFFAWPGEGGASLPSPTSLFFFGPSHGRRGVA
uniref:Putative secreted protein n=1 Tax=Ixodes ricinus TaxID=34613 RepID=A0A6B0UMV3_IXORI